MVQANSDGSGANEILIGKAFRDRRNQVLLATKFGNVRDAEGRFVGVNGRPEYVRSACDASLRRLRTDESGEPLKGGIRCQIK